jgi:hypothetical protein
MAAVAYFHLNFVIRRGQRGRRGAPVSLRRALKTIRVRGRAQDMDVSPLVVCLYWWRGIYSLLYYSQKDYVTEIKTLLYLLLSRDYLCSNNIPGNLPDA